MGGGRGRGSRQGCRDLPIKCCWCLESIPTDKYRNIVTMETVYVPMEALGHSVSITELKHVAEASDFFLAFELDSEVKS